MNKILFFAHLKDVVGKEFVELNVTGKTIAEVKDMLITEYDIQKQKLDTVMVAINEEFASDVDTVQAGDEIAFIPPVSGG